MGFDQLAALFQFGKIDLVEIAHFLVALYLSITVHEAAHAWMANRCGDDTARLMGRMSLNPIVHIDPIGTVLVPLLQVIAAGFPLIGWAKPVPVNPVRFRNMRRGEILVSLAGPASNLLLAMAALVLCWTVIVGFGLNAPPPEAMAPGALKFRIGDAFLSFFIVLLMLNLVLFLFNLIPIPPLDGSHILRVFISREAADKMDHFLMPPFNFLILLFVVLPLVQPIFSLVWKAALFLVFMW